MSATLDTDIKEKVAVLVRLLKGGLAEHADEDVLIRRRFVRTVNRLDELEFRCLVALRKSKTPKNEVGLVNLVKSAGITNFDILRSSLAVLGSEGLVSLVGRGEETWKISDFGVRMLAELNEAASEIEKF